MLYTTAMKDFLIPILSVLLSSIVAIFVARIQIKAAIQKLDQEYRRKAIELLFQKRMEVYPQFYSILLAAIKKRRTEGLTYVDLSELITQFDKWEIDNAIFISPLGLDKIRRARIILQEVLDKKTNGESLSNNKMRKILPEMYSIQMILKTELGVIDADSFHNPDKVKHFHEIIHFRDQQSKSGKSGSDQDT